MPSYRLYAGGYEGKIVQLEFDPSRPAQQRLKKIDELESGKAPTWLTFSPDGTGLHSSTGVQRADQVIAQVGSCGRRTSGVRNKGLSPACASLRTEL